jgi:hypothetical protein
MLMSFGAFYELCTQYERIIVSSHVYRQSLEFEGPEALSQRSFPAFARYSFMYLLNRGAVS